jgi:phytoene dehydrogenase-like protein
MPRTIIVGAGIAGLTCARHLVSGGHEVLILEATDRPGGRIKTDVIDGFLLDRGFQVLLDSYPTAQQELDLGALNLRKFMSGALVRRNGRFHKAFDPRRHPGYLLPTLFAPVGSLSDKIRLLGLKSSVSGIKPEELFLRQEMTTRAVLRKRYGFSQSMIERFFKPFFGGIFLETELESSSAMFEYLYRMFSSGSATLPARGMEAIPAQIASHLPEGSIRFDTPAATVSEREVRLASGDILTADRVVLACDEIGASRLLKGDAPSGRSVTCLYFAAERPPVREPVLILNGEQSGLINNIAIPTNVTASYSQDGRALVSVTVVNDNSPDEYLESQARTELSGWFGPAAMEWTHLRTYRIPYALPDQRPPFFADRPRPSKREDGLFWCGDFLHHGSIEGALQSGVAAAKAVLAEPAA